MRRPGRWTRLRYQLRQVGHRLGQLWYFVLAALEELAILIGLIPRYQPPRRDLPPRPRKEEPWK